MVTSTRRKQLENNIRVCDCLLRKYAGYIHRGRDGEKYIYKSIDVVLRRMNHRSELEHLTEDTPCS